MRARVVGGKADDSVGLSEGAVGRFLVAGLPVVDAVVGLVFLVVANQRRAGLERAERVDDSGQRLVVDVDELQRIVRDIPILGDDAGDLLALEAHLVGGEDGLSVARQRRHPRQIVLRQ